MSYYGFPIYVQLIRVNFDDRAVRMFAVLVFFVRTLVVGRDPVFIALCVFLIFSS